MKINIKTISIIGAFVALSSLAQAQNWTGNVDNNWNNSGNWSGGVPSSSTSSIYIYDTSNDPIITSNARYDSARLNIYSGASLSIANGATTNFQYFEMNGNSTAYITDDAKFINYYTFRIDSNATMHISNGASVIGSNTASPSADTYIYGKLILDGGTFSSQRNTYMYSGSNLEFILSTDSTSQITSRVHLYDSNVILTLDFDDVSTIVGGESFEIFGSSIDGGKEFGTINLATLADGLSWDLSQLYTNGVVSIAGSIIPEPSTYALIFGVLAFGLAIYRRKK